MEEIKEILLKINKLFRHHGLDERADILMKFYNEASSYQNYDPYFIGKIMSLYGGMGSFFDIVLTKEGRPLRQENIELSAYTDELYEKCIELRTSRKL